MLRSIVLPTRQTLRSISWDGLPYRRIARHIRRHGWTAADSGSYRLSSTNAAVQPDESIASSLIAKQGRLEDTLSNKSPGSNIRHRLPSWLRPYQVEVIELCIAALDRGLQRIGVSSPTGSGKTVML